MGFLSPGFVIKTFLRAGARNSGPVTLAWCVWGSGERTECSTLSVPFWSGPSISSLPPPHKDRGSSTQPKQNLAKFFSTNRMPVRSWPPSQSFWDAKFFLINKAFLIQAALPKELSLQQYWLHGGRVQAFGERFVLTWPGWEPFFAHEGIWPFLSYLNVLPKCLPAIVAVAQLHCAWGEKGLMRFPSLF